MGGSAYKSTSVDVTGRASHVLQYNRFLCVCAYVWREKLAEPISVHTEGFVTADLY